MNLADFLAKITGQSDRLEAATNKLEAAITASNAKDTEIASLREQVANFTPVDTEALNSQIATLTLERDAALNRATTAEATLETERAAMPERINTEAARIIAANGHEQVSTTQAPKGEGDGNSLEAQFRSETDSAKRAELAAKIAAKNRK